MCNRRRAWLVHVKLYAYCLYFRHFTNFCQNFWPLRIFEVKGAPLCFLFMLFNFSRQGHLSYSISCHLEKSIKYERKTFALSQLVNWQIVKCTICRKKIGIKMLTTNCKSKKFHCESYFTTLIKRNVFAYLAGKSRIYLDCRWK